MALGTVCKNGHRYVQADRYIDWPDDMPYCPICREEWQRSKLLFTCQYCNQRGIRSAIRDGCTECANKGIGKLLQIKK